MPRTPAREHFPEEELEWAENAPDRRDPDVNADHQMVINLTAQAHIYFDTGFNPPEQKGHTANFLLEGLQQVFDGTLIDVASWAVMRPDDLKLKTTVFHPCEVAPANGGVPAVMPTHPQSLDASTPMVVCLLHHQR